MSKHQLDSGKTILFLISCFLCLFSHVNAQKNPPPKQDMRQKIMADKNVTEVNISHERRTPSSIFFDLAKPVHKELETPTLLREYLLLKPGYDVYLDVKQTNLNSKLTVTEYQQFFKGIPVAYSKYKALGNNSDLLMLAGSYYDVPASLSVIPAISEKEALSIAKKQIGAKIYVWEDLQNRILATHNENIKKILQAELQEYLPKGDLVIVKDFTNLEVADMRLAYRFNLYAAEPLSRGYIYVDAYTGKILLYDAIIKHASVPTTVTTRYAGNRSIYTKQVAGVDPGNGQTLVSSHPTNDTIGTSPIPYVPGNPTFVLIDDTRGKNGGIQTYDLNNVGGAPYFVGALYAQAKSFTDVGNYWTLPEHKRGGKEGGANEAENDDIAWDAHWGAEMVYDYWGKRHNRRSYDGKDAGIKSYIHYGLPMIMPFGMALQ